MGYVGPCIDMHSFNYDKSSFYVYSSWSTQHKHIYYVKQQENGWLGCGFHPLVVDSDVSFSLPLCTFYLFLDFFFCDRVAFATLTLLLWLAIHYGPMTYLWFVNGKHMSCLCCQHRFFMELKLYVSTILYQTMFNLFQMLFINMQGCICFIFGFKTCLLGM